MPITKRSGTIVATGEGVTIFAMITLKHAIKLYASSGVPVNRAYTPGAMRRTAEKLTGRTFRPRDWQGMIDALEAKIAEGRND